ncbi:hypothetical protein [Streptosporangium sandarakinum]|uniref:hypothetical protein n=1 Tax=Streptosporangium sandarakinum TaxID=1260955 RepID=UPI00341E0873
MDRQPVVCATCNGVPPAADARAYTAQRARLIVANGYCACRSAADAAHATAAPAEAARPDQGRPEQADSTPARSQRPGPAEGDAAPESGPQSRPREERSPAEQAAMARA